MITSAPNTVQIISCEGCSHKCNCHYQTWNLDGFFSPLAKKMKAFKKIKKRLSCVSRAPLTSQSLATNNLTPLLFHPVVFGDYIQISLDGTLARRTESFCKGLCFSSRPVKLNERVFIKFVEISDNWSGVLRIGFTNTNPVMLQSMLPKYACPDLTNRPGFWGKALPEMLCQQDNLLYFYVTSSGDVRFGVNCEERECLFSGVDTKKPLYAIFDIYGNTTGIRLLNNYRPNPNDRIFMNSRQSNGQNVQQNRSIRNRPIIIEQQTPIINKNIETGIRPLRLHETCGQFIRMNRNRDMAFRSDCEFCQGYIFTEAPIVKNTWIVVRIIKTDPQFVGSFAMGLTSCKPDNINALKLPKDSLDLLDRSEYWVVKKDLLGNGRTCKEGDQFAFRVNECGVVSVMQNFDKKTERVLMHVDMSLSLWMFFDLFGATVGVQMFQFDGQIGDYKNAHKSENVNDCVICCENKVNSVLYTCGHMCMCFECAQQYWKSDSERKCPLCRALIRDVIKIFYN